MKKNTNAMACGCAVIAKRDDKTTTSADMLVSKMSRLFVRSAR